MGEPAEQRKSRRSTLLAVPDADDYPIFPMMINLCMVSMSEGLDAALFPACTEALELSGAATLNDLGILLTFQLIPQAISAPMWGIIASNAYMTRQNILILGTFFQGMATVMMTFNPVFWFLAMMRAVNGVCLASLRPIANSIAGDRFAQEERGKYFGYIMGAMQTGSALCGWFAAAISKNTVAGMEGWKFAFIMVGCFTMACAPVVFFTLKAPPVRPPAQKSQTEVDKIKKLFQRWTFTALVIQGMFGLIPWRAMEFRVKYFMSAGLTDSNAGSLAAWGSGAAALGSFAGGFIGDFMAKCSEIHGRIGAAEISVYSGIPISFFSFFVNPPDGEANQTGLYIYCIVCICALGLMGTWTPAACNNPLLCSLSEESERSVVLSWQTGLEGAVGALGGIAFTQIAGMLGYNTLCAKPEKEWPDLGLDAESCNNRAVLGSAMFICCAIPWGVCGLFYSSLHFSYKRDLDSVDAELKEKEEYAEMQANLHGTS